MQEQYGTNQALVQGQRKNSLVRTAPLARVSISIVLKNHGVVIIIYYK